MSAGIITKTVCTALTAGGIVGGGSYVIHDWYPNSLWSCKFESNFQKNKSDFSGLYSGVFSGTTNQALGRATQGTSVSGSVSPAA
ncbi:hypothetical protein MHLP_01525 [Candidatus Mycoplasma haematolamae str. Purdue]|uniref:Uncharacterized protein n=1 Tax=Mycoplasma haematolamae (strain Purdue) TaxID=1212765 RepID=I7B9D0_MYCHA|nr:hypothetical protein [Candidatus Mycoplasma haematolamae]AFO51885.1 hypothetical protein MHLP_01525 [Candidatus Mycoplasma haematolamae str. Purdue]